MWESSPACISSLSKSSFRLIRSIHCICSATNCSPFFVFRILVLDCCLASVNPYLTSDSGRSWCSKIYASAARNGSLIWKRYAWYTADSSSPSSVSISNLHIWSNSSSGIAKRNTINAAVFRHSTGMFYGKYSR